MDYTLFLPFLITFVSLAAFGLGIFVRNNVHVIHPLMDPATIVIILLLFVPGIFGITDFGRRYFDPGNIWYVAAVVSFLVCYFFSYIRQRPDMVYVNVHTIVSEEFPNGGESIKPIVYYWNKEGQMCVQEQTYSAILKTLLLGIHYPLRLDVGSIQRVRTIKLKMFFMPIMVVSPIDAVEERTSETTIRKFHVNWKVKSYAYIPAPSCIDSTQSWLVSEYNQQRLLSEVVRKDSELLQEKLAARSNFFGKAGDLLVEMINDHTPGAEVYNEIMERLEPDEPEMPRFHPMRQEEQKSKKPRHLLRRRKKKEKKAEDEEPADSEGPIRVEEVE